MSKTPSALSLSLVLAVVIAITGGQMTASASGNASDKGELFASKDSSLDAGNKANGDSFTRCTEPRSQICTREYRPVCAQLQTGVSRTYPTGCTACADPDVAGYVGGACE
jgi:hypothetical protein